jgi:hypothetical protein
MRYNVQKNEYSWVKSVSGGGSCSSFNNMYVSQDSPFRVWIWKLNKKTLVDGKETQVRVNYIALVTPCTADRDCCLHWRSFWFVSSPHVWR